MSPAPPDGYNDSGMTSYHFDMGIASKSTVQTSSAVSGPGRFPLDLRALELLAETVRGGSLGGAARRTGLTQPHASRLVSRLERDLGLPLLRRGPAGSTPTNQGRLVVDWALPILEAADRFRAGVASLHDADTGDVRIGASLTIGEHLAPAWLGVYGRRHPDARLRLRVTNSTAVLADLRSGVVDLGFIEGPHRPRGLHTSTVAHDELVVVVAPGHPWARRGEHLTLAELAASPLVLREPGSGTRETLEAALAGYPRTPPLMELSSSEAILRAVAAGAGPAVLSRLAVAGALRAGELRAVALAGAPLRRRLRAVWRPPRRPSGWAAEFIQIARTE